MITMQNRYLDGENIRPKNKDETLKLVGKKVKFIRDFDIDKSGRGYVFPRVAFITGYAERCIEFDKSTYERISSIIEMQLLNEST